MDVHITDAISSNISAVGNSGDTFTIGNRQKYYLSIVVINKVSRFDDHVVRTEHVIRTWPSTTVLITIVMYMRVCAFSYDSIQLFLPISAIVDRKIRIIIIIIQVSIEKNR